MNIAGGSALEVTTPQTTRRATGPSGPIRNPATNIATLIAPVFTEPAAENTRAPHRIRGVALREQRAGQQCSRVANAGKREENDHRDRTRAGGAKHDR